MIREYCCGVDHQGRLCTKSVGKDEEHIDGWEVVVRYPLNGIGEPRRRIICRVCARNLGAMFKDG